MYLLIKILSSAVLIGIITEIARRYPTFGGILTALPLITIISIIWLTIQGETNQNINKFIFGVLIGLPATMVMLLVIYIALKKSVPVVFAITIGVFAWGIFLVVQKYIMAAIAS